MAKKRRICFVDDEPDELSRAQRVLSEHFEIGTGTDLDAAIGKLGRKPQLFLLDMYYGPRTTDSDRGHVAEKWHKLLQAQSDFYALLKSLHQSAEGGLDLADHVRSRYPGIPIAFFTRKGSLEDADKALRQGASAVLKKPDAPDSAHGSGALGRALDDALAANKDGLVRSLSHIMDRQSWWARHARLRGFLEGVAASVVAGLILLMFR